MSDVPRPNGRPNASRSSHISEGTAAVAAVTAGLARRLAQIRGQTPQVRTRHVTYNIAKDWDLPTLLKVCQAVGLAAVECRTTHKHGVEPSLSADARRDVKKRFADSGVMFWGCGSVCEFHAADAAVVRKNIETCKEFVQLAADLGGRGVKVRPNGVPPGVEIARTLEQIGKALVECGKAAADAGVEIWVEVHGGGGVALPANMKTIMEHCGHEKVGVTWNSNQSDLVKGSVGEGRIAEAVDSLLSHQRSVQRRERRLPVPQSFRLLREMDYDRVTLCEVGRSMPTVDSGTEFLRYYKALWHELSK